MSSLRIGIDVGGTNTDAVAVDSLGTVLSSHKSATTPEVFDGIRALLPCALPSAARAPSPVDDGGFRKQLKHSSV